MPSPTQTLTRLLLLAAVLVSSTNALTPPGRQGLPSSHTSSLATPPPPDSELPHTDATQIASTVNEVEQKASVPVDALPDAPVPETAVTALDGTVQNSTVAEVAGHTARRSLGAQRKRAPDGEFKMVFNGTEGRDASIEGTAYLTYTVVNNATYDVKACTDWCRDRVQGCVFVNLYYEYNNWLLDQVFSEHSNLKCAAYGDVHTAAEKTNFGGQESYPRVDGVPPPLTRIERSSGFALDDLVDPDAPEGYELVFGPTGGANNAPGYMGFAFIDKYDPDACALLCNGRGADPNGGGCAYFNIWRAVVRGIPTTYTCSMYWLVADESTAVNFGQGDLVVTYSRGYRRISVLPDGGFEGYTACDDFCFDSSYASWTGTSATAGSTGQDATVFFFPPFAHSGHGSALLGEALDSDTFSGVLTPSAPLHTVAGKTYTIQCFMASSFSGEQLEAPARVDIKWNGARVGGVTGFHEYKFVESDAVVGTGSDVLTFEGGSAPAWTFIDDCFVYLK